MATQRETGNYFPASFVFHDFVHKWGLGIKQKIKLIFSWFLLKYLIFKSLYFNALAVLGYLPKLRRAIDLVSSAGSLYTLFIKMFLIKCPIK